MNQPTSLKVAKSGVKYNGVQIPSQFSSVFPSRKKVGMGIEIGFATVNGAARGGEREREE